MKASMFQINIPGFVAFSDKQKATYEESVVNKNPKKSAETWLYKYLEWANKEGSWNYACSIITSKSVFFLKTIRQFPLVRAVAATRGNYEKVRSVHAYN